MWRAVAAPVFLLLTLVGPIGVAHAGEEYVVRQGDTLWRISHRFGVRPADLASANRLSLETTIHPGLRLTIPGATRGPVPNGSPSPGAPAISLPAAAIREHASGTAPAADSVRTSLPSRAMRFQARVVRMAFGFVGRPYQWSGIGNRGFDCSGLVFHIFAALGLPVPHSSYAQYQAGAAVSREELAPGDLVFFRTYSPGPSHVGIYVGENQFVHASYSRGVVVSSIDEPYFRDRFIGARRI
jgi:cell wall-associated NlpC family hydrolase